MKQKALWILLFAMVLTGGAFFRFWRLNDRPMHTDEAVHAEKFKALLEKGFYSYDPDEFHGPTLNYCTLISAALRGETTFAQIDEAVLRAVPAVFGILLVVTPLFFINGLGKRSVLFCMILLAFSPAFSFYSRYYIQEMLLVCFTAFFLGCLWRSIQSGKLGWALLAGVFVGLMHASKETFVFSVAAAVAALIVCSFRQQASLKIRFSHLAGGLCSAIVVSVLFHSSFGTNWQGVIDSVATYTIWIKRAGGQSVHIHPWYYYLNLLTWLEFFEPITWNEDGIVALSVFGVFLAFSRKHLSLGKFPLIRFWAAYTVLLTAIYCFIPYKTPWCLLSFLYGMAILSGVALDWLVGSSQSRLSKITTGALIAVFVLGGPIFQCWMLNFRYNSEPTNPYVYAHTSRDIFDIVERIEQAANASKDGNHTMVEIIAAGDDYWPLPWYLRTLTHVGYRTQMDASVCQASVIVANAKQEEAILQTLYSAPKPGEKYLYVPLFEETVFLRPGVEWRGYIRNDLWNRMNTASDSVLSHQPQKETSLMTPPDKKQIEGLLKFSHQAMNTNFQIFIQDKRGSYAGRAARAAFNEVDRLETLLSRFIPNSDISRINRLSAGQEAVVDEDTMNCLVAANQAYELTGGAFDITIGEIVEAWKRGDSQEAIRLLSEQSGIDRIESDQEVLTVKVLGGNVNIDLGGMGKGYAVDRIAQVLQEWGIQRALIHGGASSVRALSPPASKKGWPVVLRDPIDETVVIRLALADEVLSCSGLREGMHIINPFTGKPVEDRKACWVRLGQNAAMADALSTSGMIMPIKAIRQLQKNQEDCAMMILLTPADAPSSWINIGSWPVQ